MKKRTNLKPVIIITSAIIWGLVIVGCASLLKGTNCYERISHILAAGVVCHLLFVWAPLAIFPRKSGKEISGGNQ